MGTVKEIALLFCAASVLTATACLLSGNALGKSMKYITALIMLCAVVSGLAGASLQLDFDIQEGEVHSADTAISLSQYQAEVLIGQILSDAMVGYLNISANANKTEEDGIIISDVTIRGVDNEKAALDAIRQNGIDCRVIFE